MIFSLAKYHGKTYYAVDWATEGRDDRSCKITWTEHNGKLYVTDVKYLRNDYMSTKKYKIKLKEGDACKITGLTKEQKEGGVGEICIFWGRSYTLSRF